MTTTHTTYKPQFPDLYARSYTRAWNSEYDKNIKTMPSKEASDAARVVAHAYAKNVDITGGVD